MSKKIEQIEYINDNLCFVVSGGKVYRARFRDGELILGDAVNVK